MSYMYMIMYELCVYDYVWASYMYMIMYELCVFDYVLHEEDKEYPKIMRYVVTMGTSHSQCGQYIK